MPAAPQLDPTAAAIADAVADRLAAKLAVGLLLTATDAARYLGIGRDAFYGLLDEPGFPRPVRVAGAGRRWRRLDLDSWVKSRPVAKRAAVRIEDEDAGP